MRFSLKNIFSGSLVALLMLVATGCSESSKPSDSVPEVAATQQDIESLSVLSGEKFVSDSKSETLSDQIGQASISALSLLARIQNVDTLDNGTTFSFFDSVLTVEDNSVLFDSITYDFSGAFEEFGINYYLFSKAVSQSNYKELQIASSNSMLSYQKMDLQISTENNLLTIALTGDSRADYFGDSDVSIARFEMTNILATIVGDLSNISSAHAGHEETSEVDEEPTSEESNVSFVFTISLPFSLTVNDMTYSGAFSGSANSLDEEELEMTSPLIRNGQNIGELRINADDELEILLRNEDGELVALEA